MCIEKFLKPLITTPLVELNWRDSPFKHIKLHYKYFAGIRVSNPNLT